jgi:hypothetical protein
VRLSLMTKIMERIMPLLFNSLEYSLKKVYGNA